MKPFLSRLLALVLVVTIGLVGCSSTAASLTGDYRQDTLALIENLQTAVELPEDSPEKATIQAQTREQINNYAARYRRDTKVSGLRSFTTMQTALNSLAGYYTSYGNRPLPEKLKKRLSQEFRQVELALQRGS